MNIKKKINEVSANAKVCHRKSDTMLTHNTKYSIHMYYYF